MGHYIVVSLEKTLSANFVTGSLRDVEDSTGVCFTTAYIGEKKIKNQNKKQVDMVLPVSPTVGLGNNCPLLNIYNVRTNSTN